MCSQRKLESARANGAKSHGPITPEGKARSSMNALKHGFSAANLALSVEEHPEFEEFREAFYDKFEPADTVECSLVNQMAAASWRQQRIWAAETAAVDLEIEIQRPAIDLSLPCIGGAGRFALAFKALSGDVRNMERYETNCSRQFERALRTLLNLRKAGAALNPPQEGPREMKLIWCGHKHACNPAHPRPNCNWRRDPDPEPSEPWDGKTKITEFHTPDDSDPGQVDNPQQIDVGQVDNLRRIDHPSANATTQSRPTAGPPATGQNEPNPTSEHHKPADPNGAALHYPQDNHAHTRADLCDAVDTL